MITPPKTFREARQRLAKIPYINAGGCGVAALALARWAQARKRTKPVNGYVFAGWDIFGQFDHENNSEALQAGEIEHLDVPNHILIDYGGTWYDVDETWCSEEIDYSLCIPNNEKILLHLINNKSWNPDFDRSRHVPTIQDVLGVDLSDVWINYAGNGYYQPSTEQLKGRSS